jgi:hypothetical protein
MKRRTDAPATPRRPYRSPALKVHGDFRRLTAVKSGDTNDGTGKPKTKTQGPGGNT